MDIIRAKEQRFEGNSLKLRLYVYHLLDPTAKFDSANIRVCVGIEGGGQKPVHVVRNVFTRLHPPMSDPKQYVVPGRSLALAHLTGRFESEGPRPLIPGLNESGDVTTNFRHSWGNSISNQSQ
jgi:hypothetical protein